MPKEITVIKYMLHKQLTCLFHLISATFALWNTTHITCCSQVNAITSVSYLFLIAHDSPASAMGNGAALSVSPSGIIPVRDVSPVTAATLSCRGDTDVVPGPPPCASDLGSVGCFVVIFRSNHFFLCPVLITGYAALTVLPPVCMHPSLSLTGHW